MLVQFSKEAILDFEPKTDLATRAALPALQELSCYRVMSFTRRRLFNRPRYSEGLNRAIKNRALCHVHAPVNKAPRREEPSANGAPSPSRAVDRTTDRQKRRRLRD